MLERMARKDRRNNSYQDWRPVRVRSWWVDQVFLRRQGGRIVAHVDLVSGQNELRTQKVFPPTGDPVAAIRVIAREVARLGNVDDARGARVRWAKASNVSAQDELDQDVDLEHEFERAFADALDQVLDEQR